MGTYRRLQAERAYADQRMIGSPSAIEAFGDAHREAKSLAQRILDHLETVASYPAEPIDWGHVGDMAETVKGLRQVSDRMFAEGEHAED